MNRLAVVLAADSATTVTYFEEGERKQRYFKGANKIFNLSTRHPVGIMTNGSGTLHSIPWEVIVKAYRESRQGKPFDTLEEYAKDFFKYLANKDLFPKDYQRSKLIEGVSETAGNIALSIFTSDQFRAESEATKKKAAAQARIEFLEKAIEDSEFLCDDCAALLATVKKDHLDAIKAELSSGNLIKGIQEYLDLDRLVNLAATAFFKSHWTDLDVTGVVVAGYGEKQLFAALEQYECYGVVLGKVLYQRVQEGCRQISFQVPSEIVPIAQDDMAYTFMFGASIRVLIQSEENFAAGIDDLVAELTKGGHLEGVDTEPLKKAAVEQFRRSSKDFVFKDASKLRRVIGMLPITELAELAETLVALESLKERVTKETETVSGPIDVAVITKGDGFIWVKRKHYFDPALNIRFISKKQEEARD